MSFNKKKLNWNYSGDISVMTAMQILLNHIDLKEIHFLKSLGFL